MATQNPKICFDRLLPNEVNRPHRVMNPEGTLRAVLFFRKLWPNGSTLRVRFMGGTSAQKALAEEQANWWIEHANLNFKFGDALDAEIRIAFDPGDGA